MYDLLNPGAPFEPLSSHTFSLVENAETPGVNEGVAAFKVLKGMDATAEIETTLGPRETKGIREEVRKLVAHLRENPTDVISIPLRPSDKSRLSSIVTELRGKEKTDVFMRTRRADSEDEMYNCLIARGEMFKKTRQGVPID